MKFLTPVVVYLTTSAAAVAIDKRQMSENDVERGNCKDVIFVWARGSTEPGNMGIIIGPQICSALKSTIRNRVACQGVGGAYTASMMDNGRPKYTSDAAINEAKKVLGSAAQKCPKAKIVFGGYSQGGAVMHGAVSTLDEATKSRLAGGVLVGDSMNGRNKGRIPNYPAEKIIEICNDGDGICAQRLAGITASHLTYGMNGSAQKAATFLAKLV